MHFPWRQNKSWAGYNACKKVALRIDYFKDDNAIDIVFNMRTVPSALKEETIIQRKHNGTISEIYDCIDTKCDVQTQTCCA